jgi:hypothetical protein
MAFYYVTQLCQNQPRDNFFPCLLFPNKMLLKLISLEKEFKVNDKLDGLP